MNRIEYNKIRLY